MTASEQKTRAQTLRALHTGGKLLVLPNVWDVIGARVLEKTGFPAIATASAAIAESLGYADGENIRFETMLEILSRISKSVSVPVTADIEAGYANTIDELEENIARVIQTGAVGINIEDSLADSSLRSIQEQCERLAAVRQVADAHDLDLVINARVDTFISSDQSSHAEKIEQTILRAQAYVNAGADCIYPIGPGDRATLDVLRARIAAPLNILALPNALGLTELESLGINRVSFGPQIFHSCLAKFVGIAEELARAGNYARFAEQSLSGADVKKFLLAGKEQALYSN